APGTLYYFWVRGRCTNSLQSGWAQGTFATKIPNDDCSGAVSLTVNPDFNCGVTTPGTLANATPTGNSSNGCYGNPNDDVWYTFVASNTTHTVDLLNVTGNEIDLYHAVFTANPCSGAAYALTCSDANNSTTSGLTVGATYYVQVYS